MKTDIITELKERHYKPKELLMELIDNYGGECERYGQYDTLAQERSMDMDYCSLTEDESEELQDELDRHINTKEDAIKTRDEIKNKIEQVLNYLQL